MDRNNSLGMYTARTHTSQRRRGRGRCGECMVCMHAVHHMNLTSSHDRVRAATKIVFDDQLDHVSKVQSIGNSEDKGLVPDWIESFRYGAQSNKKEVIYTLHVNHDRARSRTVVFCSCQWFVHHVSRQSQ